MKNHVRNYVRNRVWDGVKDQVKDQVKHQVKHQVYTQVKHQIDNQVWWTGLGKRSPKRGRAAPYYTLQYINEGDVCGEIGVWEGRLSKEILECKPKELHLIDPWKSQDVIERCYSRTQEKMDNIYENVLNDFGKLNNVKIHRNFSTDVSFPKQYFDWIYIDGDHSYEAVKKDLEFYYPLMKRGAYLCGDDYGLWEHKPKTGRGSDAGGGPKPAVDEFVNTHKLKLKVKTRQFVIFV